MPVSAVHMCLEYLIKIHWCSFLPAGCGRDGIRQEEEARESHKYTKKNSSRDERDNREKKKRGFDIDWQRIDRRFKKTG